MFCEQKNILKYISHFEIHNPNIFPDHVTLDFESKCKIQHDINHIMHQRNNQNDINTSKTKWNEKKKG